MTPHRGSEFLRSWPVILAAAVGVGLGVTGLPIYTTGEFILPLGPHSVGAGQLPQVA